MRYMFLIYSQERSEPLAPAEAETLMSTHWALMQDATDKGVLLGVDALKPTSTATTVRVSSGEALTTDGPFAETKEQLAGYYSVIRNGSALRVITRRARSCAGVRPSGASRAAWARRIRRVSRWSRSASWTGSSYSTRQHYQEECSN